MCWCGDSHHIPNHLDWPVQRTQGSWRTTGGYCEVNYVVTPVAAAVAHVAPLFEPWAHPLVPAVQWLTYLFLHSCHEVHELVLHDAHTPPRKHSCITLLPLRDTSGHSGDGKSSRWVELWEVNLPVLFASKKKMARYMMIHRVRVCSQWFDWMVMNLKGRCLENWWQLMLGRGMWLDFSEWAINMKRLVSH